jgi:hypothetical protein
MSPNAELSSDNHAKIFQDGRALFFKRDAFSGKLSLIMGPSLRVKIDQRAYSVLHALSRPKILVTVETTIYYGCCGGYEDKSLKVESIGENNDVSNLLLVSDGIETYIHPDALSLIESRGAHFTVYADLNGRLYSDQ